MVLRRLFTVAAATVVLVAGASAAEGRLNTESATGLRVSFVNPPGGSAGAKPYRVGEIEAYGAATAGGGGVTAGGGGTAAGTTLTLVDVKTTNTYSPQNWTVDAASRTMVGTFPWGKGTYQYTVPSVIPPSGAAGKLKMTINATQRWATGFSLFGNVDISPAAAIDESTDTRGLSFTAERAFTIKPAKYPAGTTFVEIVGRAYYNEGPSFTFRYNVGAAPSGVAAPSGALVGSSFDGGTTQPSIDLGRAPEPVVISTQTAHTAEAPQLTVSVTGNGIVVMIGRALSRNGGGAAPISCGLNRFLCYARLDPQQRVTLQARPLPRYRFRAWTGACAGQGPSCTVSATALSTVTAVFVPKDPGAAIALDVLSPNFSVRWAQSVGNGALVVRGRVARRSRLVLQVRRPGGGPLLFKYLSASGAFTQTMSLRPSQLPPGAKLFPGGFVVSVTGTSGGFQLPLQLRTVVLRSPSEGVVRQAFSSASREGGAQPRFPRGTKEVWANFRFATQPLRRMPVTVTWYRPNGSKLGTVAKANRPEVESFMAFGPGLPSGLWTAELRAGGRVAKRLAVRIS